MPTDKRSRPRPCPLGRVFADTQARGLYCHPWRPTETGPPRVLEAELKRCWRRAIGQRRLGQRQPEIQTIGEIDGANADVGGSRAMGHTPSSLAQSISLFPLSLSLSVLFSVGIVSVHRGKNRCAGGGGLCGGRAS